MYDSPWPARIAEMSALKREIAENDHAGLWTHHPPGSPATEDELRAAEQRLHEPFDDRYRSFLRHVAGWPSFFQSVDLFSPADVPDSPAYRLATETLTRIEPAAMAAARLTATELLPIAATTVDLDLFVIGRRTSSIPGAVVWFAGYEIERFDDFDAYFLAMIDYNRSELRALRQSH
jgi:hypothetical protein